MADSRSRLRRNAVTEADFKNLSSVQLNASNDISVPQSSMQGSNPIGPAQPVPGGAIPASNNSASGNVRAEGTQNSEGIIPMNNNYFFSPQSPEAVRDQNVQKPDKLSIFSLPMPRGQ